MPFDAVETVRVFPGGRIYVSTAGAHAGMRYDVSVNEDGQILVTPEDVTTVGPSVAELCKRWRRFGTAAPSALK